MTCVGVAGLGAAAFVVTSRARSSRTVDDAAVASPRGARPPEPRTPSRDAARAAPGDLDVAASARDPVDAGDEPRAPAASQGRIVLQGLTTEFHVALDGVNVRCLFHDVDPGPHTIVLFRGAEELGRADVVVEANTITAVPLAAFDVRDVCLARIEHEELLPAHAHPSTFRARSLRAPPELWLARHQSANGLWSPAAFDARCVGGRCDGTADTVSEPEATALVLLALLGMGETPHAGRYRAQVTAALQALCAGERLDLRVSVARREHALVALAVAEALLMTGSRRFRTACEQALVEIAAEPPPADAETAALEAFVLRAARDAEVDVAAEPARVERALRDLRSFGVPVRHPARERAFLAAARALLVDDPASDAEVVDAVAALVRELAGPPPADPAQRTDPMTLWAATLAARAVGGDLATAWGGVVERHVVATQESAGVCPGTWAPARDERSGRARDRLTTTALHHLTLLTWQGRPSAFGTVRAR